MTDSMPATPPPEPSPPPTTPPPEPATGAATSMSSAQAQAASMLARLSTAEQLAVLGAVLILLVEVVTGLLLDRYYSGDLVSLLAVAVLIAAWIRHAGSGEVPLGYGTVIRIAGLAVVLIAATDLIVELRRGAFDNATDIVGGIGYYAGAALMAVGAFQIKEP